MRLIADTGKIRPQHEKRSKNRQLISINDVNYVIDRFIDNKNVRQSWPEGKSSGYLLSCFWF
ncbi:hypothetical protein DKJ29_24805 [Salmonella enterica]|nr:hypothetical protein [Salmonella enterica]EAS2903915.1 hypothetical protein [Salmonella enterica]EBM3426888.1 hypothetical protein [Salmonella enterica]OIN17421.1 hypothetical protein AO411_2021010 [Salmonella enterica subsp. enterica serovar Sarajane]